MAKILVLHGPNLNMLGKREPVLYGQDTLEHLNNKISALAETLGHDTLALQSNSEETLIHHIQQCGENSIDFILFNPAAFTHTSVALRDALLGAATPFIEIHITNVAQREPFRQLSYFADIAIGTITGLGTEGYLLALRYAHHYLTHSTITHV